MGPDQKPIGVSESLYTDLGMCWPKITELLVKTNKRILCCTKTFKHLHVMEPAVGQD